LLISPSSAALKGILSSKIGFMWRLVVDWAILAPGKLLATVVGPLLFLLPLLAGFGAWLGVAMLLEGRQRNAEPATATMVWASLAACYAFLVVGVAVADLPAAISRFMKMAD
jgi:hypothetical protein